MFQQLTLLTLFVLTAHALVLLGLPYWMRTVPAVGNPSIFLIRAITSPLQPADTTAPIASRRDLQPPKPLPSHPHPSLPSTPLATDDEGTMPSAPPSPSEQALSTAPSARQSNPSAANVPDARAPEPMPLVQLPRSAQLAFQAVITTQDRHVTALPSTIDWKHDDHSYDLRWTLAGSATGEHGGVAVGHVTTHGLAPQAAAAASVPMPAADALDPLSAWIELGALIAANPSHYLVGSRISVLVMDSGDQVPRPVDYIIMDDGDVDAGGLFAGESLPALHLIHVPIDAHDARVELWLGKLFDYLPIRLIVIEPDGDRLDMTMQSTQTQT